MQEVLYCVRLDSTPKVSFYCEKSGFVLFFLFFLFFLVYCPSILLQLNAVGATGPVLNGGELGAVSRLARKARRLPTIPHAASSQQPGRRQGERASRASERTKPQADQSVHSY